ncbi:MAG: hypothetical protein J7L51_04050 [Desulfurococcales archaeon]|nr:hypothetical protein [Desulfurococcales archaeon]
MDPDEFVLFAFDDHANAIKLAHGIANLPGVEISVEHVETNIIRFAVTSMPAEQFARRLYEAGVYVLATGPDTVRAVTNLDVDAEQIDQAMEVFEKVVGWHHKR